jgi:DNA segregation ATPase FtsK/SpoIIIE, S-DNA-T family
MFQEKEEIVDHERSNFAYNKDIVDDIKGKELETRVTYFYPRGQGLGHLLSAEENKTKQGRVRPKRENDKSDTEIKDVNTIVKEKSDRKKRKHEKGLERLEQIHSEMIRQEKRMPVKYLNQQEQTVVVEPIVQEQMKETRTKISKKGSRPFRPTEIPSPIYGFTKRTQQSEIVEFELTSEIEERTFSSGTVEQTSSIFSAEDVPYSTHPKEEMDVDKEIDAEEDNYLEEDIQVDVDKEWDLAFEPNGEMEEDGPIEYPVHTEGKEEFETVMPLISAVNVPSVTEVGQKECMTEPSKEEIEKQPTQRSHLPFNVLMLNQDKRKWEQKKIERAVQLERQYTNPQEKVVAINEETIVTANNQLSNSYTFPDINLLNPPMTRHVQENIDWIENQEHLLNEALKNFGVRASVVNITQGPSVTRFEVQPEPGVKVNKITNLSDDIKLSLAAKDIRIEAPIPGKHTIGIEVPNKKSRPVLISEIIKTESFQKSSSPLTAVLGLDISGAPVVTDLKKMPHGLIAGATGSGKSVCINSILVSLLYKASPHELKLLLIDPKMVELAPYNHIPHLVSPVITDVKAATAALKWAVDEMERRYELFAHTGVRDINRFNEIADQHKRYSDKLPFIVIIIDELADLMMMSPADVEESICRIAQKARACGIHLIIATQRPSVDVITGLIKANVPTRTAFSVSSQIDSRTIIDISGAEKLLGRGDMLFLENGSSKPVRLQGTFVSDAEIDLVVEHVRKQQEPEYLFHQDELLKRAQVIEEDELFYEACEFIIEQGGASTSSVQRKFKIGYNRAARLIDMMEQQGFISEPKGSKPRDVLITEEVLEQIQENTSGSFK